LPFLLNQCPPIPGTSGLGGLPSGSATQHRRTTDPAPVRSTSVNAGVLVLQRIVAGRAGVRWALRRRATQNLPPEWRANLGFSYDRGNFFFSANANYQDEAFWADVPFAEGTTDSFVQVNTSIGVRLLDERMTLSVLGSNIFDETSATCSATSSRARSRASSDSAS
jgi:hypothetical protein